MAVFSRRSGGIQHPGSVPVGDRPQTPAAGRAARGVLHAPPAASFMRRLCVRLCLSLCFPVPDIQRLCGGRLLAVQRHGRTQSPRSRNCVSWPAGVLMLRGISRRPAASSEISFVTVTMYRSSRSPKSVPGIRYSPLRTLATSPKSRSGGLPSRCSSPVWRRSCRVVRRLGVLCFWHVASPAPSTWRICSSSMFPCTGRDGSPTKSAGATS